METENIIYGEVITWVTMVGYLIKEYPSDRGNCFSMDASDNNSYRIVNFNYENLNELLKRGLTLPVRLKVLDDKIALIDDERISNKWYQYKYCSTCCPKELLPEPQKLALERDIRCGAREEHPTYTVVHLQSDTRL